MRYLFTFICVIATLTSFGQYGEEVGPLTGNPALLAKKSSKVNAKINVGTFDSTFIYLSDTLNLPFFDEFSTSKFQEYVDDFPNADSSQKIYRLLAMSDVALPNTVLYT